MSRFETAICPAAAGLCIPVFTAAAVFSAVIKHVRHGIRGVSPQADRRRMIRQHQQAGNLPRRIPDNRLPVLRSFGRSAEDSRSSRKESPDERHSSGASRWIYTNCRPFLNASTAALALPSKLVRIVPVAPCTSMDCQSGTHRDSFDEIHR